MAAVTISGTSGSDTLFVAAASADSGSTILDGGAPVAFSGATSFTFNASAGADTFIIANPTSGFFGPPGGITFNGGGEAGDSLVLLGGAALDSVYIPLSSNSGPLFYDTQEVQRVAISGAAGTFTLTFKGQTTAPLPFNATALQVQNALNGLSTLGGAGIAVGVDKTSSQYTITLQTI